MRLSSEERARQDPLSHSVDADGRYWDHGGPPSLGGYLRDPVRTMPHPPAEGSVHRLLGPDRTETLFRWVEGLWHVVGEPMSRLAYSPAMLGSRGWKYLGADAGATPERKRSKKDT